MSIIAYIVDENFYKKNAIVCKYTILKTLFQYI